MLSYSNTRRMLTRVDSEKSLQMEEGIWECICMCGHEAHCTSIVLQRSRSKLTKLRVSQLSGDSMCRNSENGTTEVCMQRAGCRSVWYVVVSFTVLLMNQKPAINSQTSPIINKTSYAITPITLPLFRII